MHYEQAGTVYSKRRSCKEPTMILDQEVFVSGLVDESGDLFICFEETVGKGIKLFPVIFNDNDGKWCLNHGMRNPVWGTIIFLSVIMQN